MTARLLILGGTTEAADLARALDAQQGFQTITSLAGRTRSPEMLPGDMHIGGFGGVSGLTRYLEAERIDVLIDATHPFAKVISQHALLATGQVGIPRLRLIRPPWPRHPDDRWIEAVDAPSAAEALRGLARRVFLTTGHRDLPAFVPLDDIWFLIRTIEPAAGKLPKQIHRLLARGPFDETSERELLLEHKIDAVVTKASGGEATYAKIAAARSLSLPVIVIQRPPQPLGPTVHDTTAALAWLRQVTA